MTADTAAADDVDENLAAAAPQAAGEGPEPLCADVATWVEHIYAPTYIRRISQTQRWCPSWWAHSEAIVRLTALWRTWEAAQLADDDAGMADWLRTYLDALNPVLLAADGPFASCTTGRHSEQAPLPVTTAPSGYWTNNQQ